ncbi:M48 family metalloprotease [Streptomyces sp. NPDC005263]|uniref:M48 family metalloprotease n=1 Tax=Streptomyces sp. NPDC005263 TaxID=3364711 RepID=UPI003688D2FA
MSQPPTPPVPPGPAYPDPPYPETAPPGTPSPAYPAPPYPETTTTSPTYPAPPYPETTTTGATYPAPAYPTTAIPATAQPAYPQAPAYPEPTAPAPHQPRPGTPSPNPDLGGPWPDPARPGPGAGRPGSGHPDAAPAYPGPGPAYPGADPTYPVDAGAAPPPYVHPGAVPPAPAPPGVAPLPPPQPDAAPDDLDYRHRGARVHVAEHQRGADATAIGRLAVQLPGALVSLALVSSLALGVFGSVMGTFVIVAWVASGLLVFHRPTELAFARHVLKLRLPTPDERARLEPVWHEVTARAGIERGTYELMVENSEELNAAAVAGHVVGVTTYALNRIPSSNLAAVLAHELGHHTGGHAWAGLLGYWYSLPGRIAWAVTRALARFAIAVAGVFSMAATGFLILFMSLVVVAAFFAAWYITIPLVAAPYLLAYAGRRGELRADQQAAELGFARQLAEVLHHFQTEETATKAALVAQGQKLREPGTLTRLLSTHPDHRTRLSELEPFLRLTR